MHANLILVFKPALYSSTLVIKVSESSIKLFYAKILTVITTTGQSSFISFATCMARPLLKLKCSILLVLYNWLNGLYRVMNGKYSITLLFFESNTQCTKAPPINIIDSKCCTEKLKGSRTCLIGYLDFISYE